MQDQFSRTRLLFGTDNMEILARSRVIVFGIGGVGSFTVEALVRSGLGTIDIVDDDTVSLTNVNRQLYALHSTVGQYKVDVAEARILDINPDCAVTKHRCFFLPETSGSFDFSCYDYVVDCIDTVKGKLHIIERAKAAGVPVISCMGAGNKVDPTQFRIADISGTSVCPLARVMRQELKKRRITDVKVLVSTEPAVTPLYDDEIADGCPTAPERKTHRQVPGSNAFTPSVAGLIIAGEEIKDLTGFRGKQAVPSAR
ncbi:MAG: tRNA threonylcarbamoyladenosine dehydratase [Treponemataceae bacterium]|nr:tRNA threonylcarbamoyladenosine dehydratase [Treponemataceae bacterium]